MRKAWILLALAGCAPGPEPPSADGRITPLGINLQGYAEHRREADGMPMVLVPAGPYPRRPYERKATTEPPEIVRLPAYFIDKYEVSNAQLARFLNAVQPDGEHILAQETAFGLRRTSEGWKPQKGFEEHPAVGITGWGALLYASWVGGELPDPDRWMKAAGGPRGLEYPFGEWKEDACTWYGGGARSTSPVKKGGPSPVGCLNMAGNVYERVMCQGAPVMLKGGSWVTNHRLNLRVLDLCMQPMDVADPSVGFRCVMNRTPEVLRFAPSLAEGLQEAKRRNCPVLLSLQYDTCGQCDRLRAQLFMDPVFVAALNAGAVLVVGQAPGDAGENPHPPGPDGACPLYPGLTCAQHEAIFRDALQAVGGFRVSPGNFILSPEGEVLVGEMELPKSGTGTEVYLARLREAQTRLGPGKP